MKTILTAGSLGLVLTNSVALLSTIPVARGQDLLSFEGETLRIERNYVPQHVARQLYQDLLELSENDKFDANVVDYKGDAGAKASQPQTSPTMYDIHRTVQQKSDEKKSVVFRIENLTGKSYNSTKELVHKVVPNNVLEDKGTIHVYFSSPGAAALANHTDVTDIFVLQLDGAKDWFLCEVRCFLLPVCVFGDYSDDILLSLGNWFRKRPLQQQARHLFNIQ